MRIIVAVALALSFPAPLAAQSSAKGLDTGNDFVGLCSSDEVTVEKAVCTAYVRGLFDAFRLACGICPPDGVTIPQMFEIGRKAIQELPQDRHKPASFLIWESWFSAFPCPKK